MLSEYEARTKILRRMYAKGRVSVRDCYLALAKSEGLHDIDSLAVMAEASLVMSQAVFDLSQGQMPVPAGSLVPHGPVIVPHQPTPEQRAAYATWCSDDWEEPSEGYDTGVYLLLDTIKWKFGPGWRRLYPFDN